MVVSQGYNCEPSLVLIHFALGDLKFHYEPYEHTKISSVARICIGVKEMFWIKHCLGKQTNKQNPQKPQPHKKQSHNQRVKAGIPVDSWKAVPAFAEMHLLTRMQKNHFHFLMWNQFPSFQLLKIPFQSKGWRSLVKERNAFERILTP